MKTSWRETQRKSEGTDFSQLECGGQLTQHARFALSLRDGVQEGELKTSDILAIKIRAHQGVRRYVSKRQSSRSMKAKGFSHGGPKGRWNAGEC